MSGVYWIASYPKSGNTWLRLLLRSYCAGGAAVDINADPGNGWTVNSRTVFDESIGISASDLTDSEIFALWPSALEKWLQRRTTPAYLKTHELCRPFKLSLGAAYIVRDPRDVAISLARHTGSSIDAAIEIMGTTGKFMSRSRFRLQPGLLQCWGSWSQNVESWLSTSQFPIHFLHYEAMRAHPTTSLARLLPTLGFKFDNSTVMSAVAATQLNILRAQEAKDGFIEAVGPNRFFGEGNVEGWRQILTSSQCARILTDHGPMMDRLGYLNTN